MSKAPNSGRVPPEPEPIWRIRVNMSVTDTDNSANSPYDLLRLPSEHRPAVSDALGNWNAANFKIRKQLSGRSGAAILLVDIELPNYNGVAVLKCGEQAIMDSEVSNHNIASNLSASIRDEIPQIVATYSGSSRLVLLMSVVGWSLLEVDPMTSLTGGDLNLACQLVSQKLLTEWNPRIRFDNNVSSLNDVLTDWVARQIGNDSRIPAFIATQTTIPKDAAFFRYVGTDYPNPLFIRQLTDQTAATPFYKALGVVHGDLHTGNILLSRWNPGKTAERIVYFIDFDTFSLSAPLFFDHSYLELSILMAARADVTPQRWKAICDDLVKVNEPQNASLANSTDDSGLLRTCGMLRSPIMDWIKKHHAPRTEDLKKQLYASRIAAGLNFCNKKQLDESVDVSNKKKFFAFLYAASYFRMFMEYSKDDIRSDGPSVVFKAERPLPKTSNWRPAWDACRYFDESKASFILICDDCLQKESEFTLKMLSRLSWRIIVDLSAQGVSSNFAKTGLDEIRKNRSVFHAYPHQIAPSDFGGTTAWIATEIDQAVTTGKADTLAAWKKRSLSTIRQLASQLYGEVTPKPVIVVVLGREAESVKLRSVFSAIQESIPEGMEVVAVSTPDSAAPGDVIREEVEKLQEVFCATEDFMLGAYQMLGDDSQHRSIWLPVRSESREKKLQRLTDSERSQYAATIELVPASLSDIGNSDVNDVGDFLKGKPITWNGLDAHADVDRDITKRIVPILRKILEASPNESFAIEHSPGAGGSSVARRVAWELRDEFPAAIISLSGPALIDTLESLFQKTNLPLLLIVEAGQIPVSQRDLIFSELKARNVRFLLLDVKRRMKPQDSDHSINLADPMSITEARRFLGIYRARAPRDRHPLLDKLVSERPEDRSHGLYRSPFFFGLYAFERDFEKVESYVGASVFETADTIRRHLSMMALISRYSQLRMPMAAINTLIGLDPVATASELEAAFGDGPSRLIFCDGQTATIKHPLLAEAILKNVLQPSDNDNPDAWRGPLVDFCISTIQEFAEKGLGHNERILEILYDLFLERQTSQGSNRTNFAELMEDFHSPQGERSVFETLCQEFPDNSRFLSHFARNINYRKTGTFEEAVWFAERSIALDAGEDDHHHILGMIYRFEIERKLEACRTYPQKLNEIVDSIDPLFSKAAESFQKARNLRPDNQFPLITPIQMTLHTLESLFSLERGGDFISFLEGSDAVAAWCRGKLDYAEWLFDSLHQLEANSQPSERRVRCDAHLSRLMGDFGAMLSRLRSLLKRSDVAKGPVRRLIAISYLKQIGAHAGDDIGAYQEIAELSAENLAENPGGVLDLRNWIRAYRTLPSFAMSKAIDRVTRAANVSDDVEPLYYSMILHFMAHRLGFPASLAEAKRYAEMCKHKSASVSSKKSYEWVANDALRRPLQLVHHSEIGEWSKEQEFFAGVQKLGRVEGRIDEIKSPQAGTILVDGMPAFFVPRSDFRRAADTNRLVTAFIGFSYEGLRAWNVKKA